MLFVTSTVSRVVQVLFVVAHTNLLLPGLKFLTMVLYWPALSNVLVPFAFDHAPVPIAGLFPASNAVSIHKFWSGPASALVGRPFVIITVSDREQALYVTVHNKLSAPYPNPVTVVLYNVLFANVAAPLIMLHIPLPSTGALADSVALVEHTV